MINKKTLINLYFKNKLSMAEVAKKLHVSIHKVNYWMDKYGLQRRSWSQASYVKHNPHGDPFLAKRKLSKKDWFLKGLGLGMYWGEGTKKNNFSVRISNSDPQFIKGFITFLVEIYQIDKSKLRFALHLFSDINEDKAINYWCKQLNTSRDKFYKTQIINLRRKGSYKKKSKYGVITLLFGNKKLLSLLKKDLKKLKMPS